VCKSPCGCTPSTCEVQQRFRCNLEVLHVGYMQTSSQLHFQYQETLTAILVSPANPFSSQLTAPPHPCDRFVSTPRCWDATIELALKTIHQYHCTTQAAAGLDLPRRHDGALRWALRNLTSVTDRLNCAPT
jgi:hypothetical protein